MKTATWRTTKEKTNEVNDIMSFIISRQTSDPELFDTELWQNLENRIHDKALYAKRKDRSKNRTHIKYGETVEVHSSPNKKNYGNINGVKGVLTSWDYNDNTAVIQVTDRRWANSKLNIGDTLKVPVEYTKLHDPATSSEVATVEQIEAESIEEKEIEKSVDSLYSFLQV